jgi:tetratricopeptide (TPR) repeat protein
MSLTKITSNVILFAFVLSFFGVSNIYSQTDPKAAKNKMMELLGEVDYVGASKLIQLANQDKGNQKDWEFQLLCGDIYLELENLDSAYYFYNAASNIEDDEPQVLIKTGRIESLKGNYAVAIKILEKAINDNKKNVDLYLELADAHIRENKLSEAEIIVNRARKLDEKEPRIYLTLGDMYFAQKVFALAQTNYEQALSLDSENMNAMLKLAESYQRLANQEPPGSELADELFTMCLKQYNQVTKRDPKNAKALLEQGKILFWSQKYADAANVLYAYSQLRPDGSLGRWFLAQSLLEYGKCDSASSHLQYAAQTIDTVKVKAQILLGQCYYNQKEYGLASQTYDKVYNDTVLSFADYRRYATAKLFSGDTVNSVRLYKEVLDKLKNTLIIVRNLKPIILS